MSNHEIAALLRSVAEAYELEGVKWKPRAYERAATNIESLDRDVSDIYETEGEDGLKAIPGVGKAIAAHIIEYIETGQVEEFTELFEKEPEGLRNLLDIQGLGPNKVRTLREELGITNVGALKKAAESGKIRELSGFGKKTEENILKSLDVYQRGQERMSIGIILPLAEQLLAYLKENAPINKIAYAGSLRRGRDTIGDIDILAVSGDAEAVMDAFVNLPQVDDVLAQGENKSMVLLQEGLQVDIRVLPEESYGAALQYFTGSKQHNIAIRKEAIRQGYKLSEYGLFKKKSGEQIPCTEEKTVYETLGYAYIPPELREDRGELTAAKKDALPALVTTNDLNGDLHLHTTFSDGSHSVVDMVEAAAKRGYAYVAITDHSPSARIAGGLSQDELAEQWAAIEAVESNVAVLKGSEVNILKDGELDYPDSVLEQLDVVVASVHSHFALSKKEMTERLVKAVKHPATTILGHPTTRQLGKRGEITVDWGTVFAAAAEHNVAIEINSQPQRLDLYDQYILAAKKHGCRFSINTDSHAMHELDLIRYGVLQARRGWLEKEDVINTYTLDELQDATFI